MCEKIVTAAARKRELREHKDFDPIPGCIPDDLNHLSCVIVCIRNPNDRGSCCNFYKPILHEVPPNQSRMRSAM